MNQWLAANRPSLADPVEHLTREEQRQLAAWLTTRQPALAEFGAKVAAMAVHPYLREVVASLSVRMGLDAKPLPLLRSGDLSASEVPRDKTKPMNQGD